MLLFKLLSREVKLKKWEKFEKLKIRKDNRQKQRKRGRNEKETENNQKPKFIKTEEGQHFRCVITGKMAWVSHLEIYLISDLALSLF